MSEPVTNLTERFAALQTQLTNQHTALLAAIQAHRLSLVDMINRVERLLDGTAINNTLYVNVADTVTRLSTLVTLLEAMDGDIDTIRADTHQAMLDYQANNPLVVAQLNQLNDTADNLKLTNNSTNQTVGEIYVLLQECLPCGDPVFESPADCGSKQLLISEVGQQGNMQRESDDAVVVPNRLWVFDTPSLHLGMPYGTDNLYLSTMQIAFYFPDHAIDNVYISNIGANEMIVYYVDDSGTLGNLTLAGGTICHQVPETWFGFVLSYDTTATGFEAYIAVSAKE